MAPAVAAGQLSTKCSCSSESPNQWSFKRKSFVLATGVATVVNSSLSSSLPGSAIPSIAAGFKLSAADRDPVLVTPISLFLVGYVFGPLAFAPLSESWGRQRLLQAAFAAYTALTLECCLAPTWNSLLVFRLLAGIAGSAPLAIVPGIIADMYEDPAARGRAVANYMTVVVVAPLVAPSIAGALSQASWRWVFWVSFILAVITCVPLALLPETNNTKAKAGSRCKGQPPPPPNTTTMIMTQFPQPDSSDRDGVEEEEAESDGGWKAVLADVLLRPLRILVTEPIAATTCIYLALIYAIFYMYFQVYPLIFQGIYRMSPFVAGLMFLPIAAGACFSQVIFYLYDNHFERARAKGAAWTMRQGSRRLPLACFGGPLMAVSMFWLGWTANAAVPWAVPFLSGFFFGLGDLIIFGPLLNYLADSYGVFAASAMAASSSSRSVIGAVLPLASYPMYGELGIAWATTLLACLTLVLSVIPFVFMRYSQALRDRSRFCRSLPDAEAHLRDQQV